MITDEMKRKKLGLYLGITDFEFETTRLNNANNFTKANYDMLIIWFKNTTNRNDAGKELEEALRKCKLNLIVEEVLRVNDV